MKATAPRDKWIGGESKDWNDRGHFFAAAAEAMRRILVENARRKGRLKRGAREGTGLDEATLAIDEPTEDMIALDEALTSSKVSWGRAVVLV